MINVLYICDNILNPDIVYSKYIQSLNFPPNTEINENYILIEGSKYDIIYLNNCRQLNIEMITKYLKYLNINGMLYINNLTTNIYQQIRSLIKSKSYKTLDLTSYDKLKYYNYTNLINNFNKYHDIYIYPEMKNGLKKEHWIWYVFPTELAGISDPEIKTTIDPFTADLLIKNKKWMDIHRLIYTHIKVDKANLFPEIDIDRICYFINYMKNIPLFQTKSNGLDDYLKTFSIFIRKHFLSNSKILT